MTGTAGGVRRQRSGRAGTHVVGVTGASGELGSRLVRRLLADDEFACVVGIDTIADAVNAGSGEREASWRVADVRDPALRSKLDGLDTLVHLATARSSELPAAERRAVNVHGTENVLRSAAAAGVARVVLITSAMVYGAHPDNPVPLAEDAPLRAEPDRSLVGDWLEMERLAARVARGSDDMRVVVVRPASVVGCAADGVLARLFEAPRLLAIRDGDPHWQFCHADDLVEAMAWAAAGRVDGIVTVGSDGWLDQSQAEQASGLRSVAVPSTVAFATAERLHRIGVLRSPASELRYLLHPWVVGAQRLRAAGWEPAWSNADALRAHLALMRRDGGRDARKDATRAAAGAAVAVVGTLAIARARANRRRRLG